MRQLRTSWLRHAALVLACPAAAASLAVPAAAAVVTVDVAERHQTILGWGGTVANVHAPEPLRRQVLEALVNDLGLTGLRLEPPSGNRAAMHRWERDNDDGDPHHIRWGAFSTEGLDRKVSEWIVPFKALVEANGEPFRLYVSPSFFQGGSSGDAPAWLLHSPGEYAEYALAVLLHLRDRHGVVATNYSICNEAGNNNAFSSAVVGEMIRALGPRLAEAKLPTRVQFPECVNPQQAWRYIQALKDDAEVWKHVGLVSYHLYGNRDARPSIRDFAAARGLPTAQTEFMGTKIDDLFDDLIEGGVSYWEHYVTCGQGEKAASGCYLAANHNGTSFSRYGEYWNFRQVMHYVRPGAVRVGAASDDASVRAVAFAAKGKVTVVLLSTAQAAGSQAVTVRGLPAGDYALSRSARGRACEELGVRGVGPSGQLEVELPKNAVATLYPHGGGNLPPTVTHWGARPTFLTAPAAEAALSAEAADPERDAMSFAWSVVRQPDGAAATLAQAASATTRAGGLTRPGEYVFAVAVGDGTHTVRREVRLRVLAGNQPPVILDLHNRIPVDVTLPQDGTHLRGGAWDLEGDPITLAWSIVRQPPGAQAKLDMPDKGDGRKVTGMSVPGQYVFRLEARDAAHAVQEDLTVTVHPVNRPPAVESAAAKALPGGRAQLTARAADPDGDVISHWWSVRKAPPGAWPQLAAPGAAATEVAGLMRPGQYVFTLTVVDRAAVTRREVTLDVPPP